MKNYKLIGIIILAIFLRLNYDIFIPGYNFDEIAIMSTAVQSFPFGILKTAASNDYHAPLYQLIAHFFAYIPHEWIYLRLFNLLLSLLNIYVFYKIGCLIKNKNLGYIMALILAVNHLAISTVSFVKFYCLAFLLVSGSIYYFIKISKSNKGYIRFGLINFLLILTSTYGFIFVGVEYLFLLLKKRNKGLYISILISTIGLLLYLPILISQIKLNSNNLYSPHSHYVQFSLVSLYNAINDYLAPLLNYCCNLVTVVAFSVLLNFIQSIKTGDIEYQHIVGFIIFSVIPVSIGLIYALYSVKKNQIAKKLFAIATIFFLIFVLLTKIELTGMVPIYLYPFALILLMLFAVGVNECKYKKLSIVIFTIYITINLLITNVYPPDKRGMARSKIFYCYEEYFKTHENIPIIATVGARFVKKYYKNRNIIDFDNEKMRGNFQRKYIELIFGADISNKLTKKTAQEVLKPLIMKKYRNNDFEKYFVENVYNEIPKNGKIVLSFETDDESPLFIEDYNVYIKQLDKPYCWHLTKATIEQGLLEEDNCLDTGNMSQIIESYSYEYLVDMLEKYFKQIRIEQYVRNNNDRFIKTFEDNSNKYNAKFLAKNADNSWIFVTYQKQ